MANILATLLSSANTLDAYSKVLQVTQDNVANASTPGFAKQNLPLEAMQMDLEAGTTGGVTTGQVQSARDEFSEQAVRTQNTGLGFQQQAAAGLTSANRFRHFGEYRNRQRPERFLSERLGLGTNAH
ncbi:MAG TPA: hypothetical protein VG096_23945 [Bryobacteraceae bacterium]|jgi:flagellar hook-associated protein FlgK|nr:hypothetical protein [Bryobacteraceae bacterium]